MAEFKMTCPECDGAVITKMPEVLIFELCPKCLHHIWDQYDVWMAEVHAECDRRMNRGMQVQTYN